MKIIIADDDELTRKFLSAIITNAGHKAIEAETGKDVLKILEKDKNIRLLVTDVIMPTMTGKEVVKKIRRSRKWKELPIIMISGMVSCRDIYNLLELGVTWFLAKPVESDSLTELIERIS